MLINEKERKRKNPWNPPLSPSSSLSLSLWKKRQKWISHVDFPGQSGRCARVCVTGGVRRGGKRFRETGKRPWLRETWTPKRPPSCARPENRGGRAPWDSGGLVSICSNYSGVNARIGRDRSSNFT